MKYCHRVKQPPTPTMIRSGQLSLVAFILLAIWSCTVLAEIKSKIHESSVATLSTQEIEEQLQVNEDKPDQ